MTTGWDEHNFESSQAALIPVGETIRRTYDFALKGFFRVLSVMWLPYAGLVAALLAVGVMHPANADPHNPVTANEAVLVFGFLFVAAILMFIQVEGVIREALGLRRGTRLFYFSLDKQIWLLVALLVGTIIAFVAVVLAIAFAIRGCGIALHATGGALETTIDAQIGIGIAAGIALTVLLCTFLYVAIRLFFLLAPLTVVEGRLAIGRSWKLGKDNFWRMLAIYLAAILPPVIVHVLFLFAMSKALGWPLLTQSAGMERMTSNSVLFLVPYFFLFGTLVYGLLYGARAFAYRALVPDERIEDVF